MGLFMPAFFCPMFWYWDLPMLLQVGIFACFSLYYEYITLYLFTQLLIDVWIVSSSWLSSIMMPWMFFSGVLENMFALLLFDIYMDCVVARIPWWYPVTPVFAPVSSHWVQMEPVDMKRYHFPDDVNLYSKKDFADVIKATDQLTLRLGDCSGWDRPNQGNTYKGPAPPPKKREFEAWESMFWGPHGEELKAASRIWVLSPADCQWEKGASVSQQSGMEFGWQQGCVWKGALPKSLQKGVQQTNCHLTLWDPEWESQSLWA